jgi:hypothetical protein
MILDPWKPIDQLAAIFSITQRTVCSTSVMSEFDRMSAVIVAIVGRHLPALLDQQGWARPPFQQRAGRRPGCGERFAIG